MMTDLILVVVSPFIGLFLRVNIDEAQYFLPSVLSVLPVIVFFRALAFAYYDTHRIIWRYVSAVDALRLAKAVGTSTLFIIPTVYIFQIGYIPRSLYFIDALLLLLMMSGARLLRRVVYEHQTAQHMRSHGAKTLIYGAGATGQGILKRILSDKELNLLMIGFIDDDQKKSGKIISGYQVLGDKDKVSQIIKDFDIRQVVIGIPQPSPEFLRSVVAICNEFGIRPLVMTSTINEQAEAFRVIELKDLLVRAPQKIDLSSKKSMLSGKRVLITGAGGSIGSEICRQIMGFDPLSVTILDHSEFNLYTIDSELVSYQNSRVLNTKLCDIKDKHSLDLIFDEARPNIVLHAAAYKHVHLVEGNPFTSILNNILGTRNLLELCEKYNIENFVQVSTDKAVNPVGIMGATKRVCEIMTSIKGAQLRRNYCSVRFGNVLGSSGSLIPKLKSQIENNQPLTITHPDMNRYFMLIEEAVSLVLKAASISSPGDVFVLRMGEPVKIVDIAKSLIQLMGKREADVKIKYTGLRPGEKMFEELYISGKELNTEHSDILVVPKGDNVIGNIDYNDFNVKIDEMISMAKVFDARALQVLNQTVASRFGLHQANGKVISINKTN